MTPNFEKLLINALLTDSKFLHQAVAYIDDEIFQNQYYRYFYYIIKTYYDQYRGIIPYDIFTHLLYKSFKSQAFHPEEIPMISELIVEVFHVETDLLFVREEFDNYVKSRKIKHILAKASTEFELERLEDVLSELKEVEKFSSTDDMPVEYTQTLGKREIRAEPIRTGIAPLDSALGGGIAPGEFGLINAQTSGCKSVLLLNFAWAASVLSKKKTLFVTLEDSLATVLQRFDSIFSSIEFKEFRADPNKSRELIDKLKKHKDYLYVKDFTSSTCDVSKLRAAIESVGGLELIVVDYLDEMGGKSHRKDRWQEVEDAARELKGLAKELDIPIWTASQTSAQSYGKEYVGLKDTYGGKGKVHVAHIVLTICQTDTERENGKLRIIVSKQKSGPKGKIIKCRAILDKMRILDGKEE